MNGLDILHEVLWVGGWGLLGFALVIAVYDRRSRQ